MIILDKLLTRFEDYVAVICFSLMSIITLVAVFFRFALNSPIIWSEEVARYLMVWGIFIGISIMTRKNAQLGIDIFIAFAPEKVKKVVTFICHIMLIGTYIIAFYLSVDFVLYSLELGQLTPILRIKFAYVYMAMPLGFLLSTYRAIQVFWAQYFKKNIKGPVSKNSSIDKKEVYF
ncbi:TRAP transporter small permease [Caldibacillus lycopersici]|uniref:TRAP transporter small permease n=1 Tax=Perspicuibacillus lycopersici TaxID=1325689 RepID=A0AAE3IWW4_9BACI|nr:TRAP transporter small permease [Perspicuibacillus lycopersici]MCU9614884.1 TRAP transporter small permease [Perspicuibacillus lycopersici]